MKRKVIDELIKWKQISSKQPILLSGVKGVGKTYLAYDFAKAFFEQISYLNFERDPGVRRLFQSTDIDQTITSLNAYFSIASKNAADTAEVQEASTEIYADFSENPSENNILILDEISYCEEVMKLLKNNAFLEHFPHIILISSIPIPKEYQGQLAQLPIYPMEFDEFLRATGNEWYIELITTHYQSDKKIPEIVHKELLTLHQLFLQIGGMPGSINEYLNLSSTVNIAEQHGFLIGSYHDYILRGYSDSDSLKMNQVLDSITLQLLKENKKFQYKLIRKGTTHTMYKDAIRNLTEAYYVIRCNRIGIEQLLAPETSLLSECWVNNEANTNFKLYLPDTGILNSRMAEEHDASLKEYHQKSLLENYAALTLQTKNYPFAFWESDSMAKIDFITLNKGELLPIEIYENDNTRSKSISILKQKCSFPYSIKVSSKNFEFSNQVKYVPYYAMFCI